MRYILESRIETTSETLEERTAVSQLCSDLSYAELCSDLSYAEAKPVFLYEFPSVA